LNLTVKGIRVTGTSGASVLAALRTDLCSAVVLMATPF
jgi:hypothetical protein